ncbi:hypothetical protein GOBAR_AA22342 [Gossypium barbadense]|uniref:Ripening-related protein grip22 n=1 Tax=Gossypium barbadense TaxID=3634 RepID=A0A2P5X4R5_GOSBA|nr:hypothetical protein GOBAR_AA22342 [Gossypium barbadense]
MVHVKTYMIALVSSFAPIASAMMIPMWGLISAEEVALHLYEETASLMPSSVRKSSTKAKLTINDFSQGGNGGDRSKCDEQSHDNSERIVALSTGWYDGGSRCGKMIRIMASNGKSVTAKVVDECDSMHGCDEAHAYQRPCNNKIIDGSNAVWSALKLNREKGIEDVT